MFISFGRLDLVFSGSTLNWERPFMKASHFSEKMTARPVYKETNKKC